MPYDNDLPTSDTPNGDPTTIRGGVASQATETGPHPGHPSAYVPTDEQMQTINNNFVYHAPKGDQQARYVELREMARRLAIDIVRQTPKSREQSLALTKLEEAIFWANAAIARNE